MVQKKEANESIITIKYGAIIKPGKHNVINHKIYTQ